jgi:hypothetical protein
MSTEAHTPPDDTDPLHEILDAFRTFRRKASHIYAVQRYDTEKLFVTKSMPPLDEVIS